MFFIFLFIFALSLFISLFWVRGIDFMNENHPDYKGEDFLNWNITEEDKKQIL